MTEPTLPGTWEEFKKLSREFTEAAPTLDMDELNAAFECLALAYLGMSETMWTGSAVIVMRMAMRIHDDCIAKLRAAALNAQPQESQ